MKFPKIKKEYLILAAIIAAGAVARYWGISFGLPYLYSRPDEEYIVPIAVRCVMGELNPGRFEYPSLYRYIVAFAYFIYFLCGIFTGRYRSSADFAADFFRDQGSFIVLDRCIAAFFGTAAIFVVYRIAKRLFDKRTALIAAFFLSLAYLHARDSHFGVTDIPQAFFITASVLFIVRSYQTGLLRDYAAAGALAGLAMSTKYMGAFLVIPILAAHALRAESAKERLFDRRIFLSLAAFAAAFFLASPFILIAWRKFLADVLMQSSFFDIGHLGLKFDIGWVHHARVSLFHGLGWPLFLSSLAGGVILLREDLKKAIILCSFPVVYYGVVGSGYVIFVRYIIPAIPFLCILGAVFTVRAGGGIAAVFRRPPRHALPRDIAISSLAGLIIAVSAYNTAMFDRLLPRKDNRLIAREWVYENVPAGSSICQSMVFGLLLEAPGRTRKKGAKDRYEKWRYDGMTRKFTFNGRNANGLPQYIVLERYPLVFYSKPDEGIEDCLKAHYLPVKSFEAIDLIERRNIFDQDDAFYLPYAGFKGVTRPGPNLYIYRRRKN
jgi:hypothetical protein